MSSKVKYAKILSNIIMCKFNKIITAVCFLFLINAVASCVNTSLIYCNKRLNVGEPHNVKQNNLATLLPDLL